MDKSISGIIKERLLAEFFGKEKAKRRRVLLSYCKRIEPGLSDRDMRRKYKALDIPIGWCRKGIYVIRDIKRLKRMIQTEESRKRSIEFQINKLRSWIEKLEMVEREKQQKQEQQNQEQMRLFL